MSTSTQPDRPFVLPGDDDEVRITVHTEINGAVQAWGRVTSSEWARDANSDGPYTLTSLALVGRVHDGRLREALLDIKDMHDKAKGTWKIALADALMILTKLQPIDDGTERPAPNPRPAAHPPLTIDTVHLLSRLVNATMHGRRVRFLSNDSDAVVKGELRHIVKPDSIALLPADADLRDGRVRVTADLGVEYFLPVTDVLARMARAEFGIED